MQSLEGKYIKDIGDRTLTYFPYADDALKCAIELQHSLIKISKIEFKLPLNLFLAII